ncbi:MAG: TVP38/TMEM64 family protein [Alphaproteobacteria bacterium]|nr:TVP38/TMEM64 family protein [Alphaproteobacteria bacterium]
MATNAAAFSIKRLWPLGFLLAGLAGFFIFDLNRYLSFEALRDNRAFLGEWIASNRALALLAFGGLYVVVVAFSLPGATVMTLGGGLLFGPVWAVPVVVIAATLGATILFLAARTALGDVLRAKAGPALRKMEAGFRENELNYMFVLRLVPLFPFFLVNLAPAFLGVSLRNFVLATLFGIIPGVLVFSLAGNGLGVVFDAGGTPDLGVIFKPEILLPILGLALLALVPVVYKRLQGAKS